MKKIKRKIISGAVFAGCILFAFGAAVKLGALSSNDSVPVSLSYDDKEFPVIVLDAGHGGCT